MAHVLSDEAAVFKSERFNRNARSPALGRIGDSNRRRLSCRRPKPLEREMKRIRKSGEKTSKGMDVHFAVGGLRFYWDSAKALANFKKHGIRFEQACEAFFDPFVRLVDATAEDEAREAVIGLTEDWTLLSVVHAARARGVIRIISARRATRAERRIYENNG
jgi:uncharacterized DUF497 family protein